MRKPILAMILALTFVGVGAIVPGFAAAAVDLRVEKSDSPDPVDFEGEVTYSVSVTNDGADPATGVQVVDQLPPKNQALFKSATPGCVYATPSASDSSQTVTCPVVGGLGASGSASFQIVVEARSPGDISNSASATAAEVDANPANNQSTEVTHVRRRFELSLGVTDQADPTRVGEILNYRITVTNGGPHEAQGIVIRDQLPASVNFVSADEECSHSGGVVTCEIGRLSGVPNPFIGTTSQIDIQVRPTRPGTLASIILVNAPRNDDQDEGSRANNTRFETTRVRAASPSLAPAACANRKAGDGGRNILLGTRRGDRLLGYGGRDRLFGYRGLDCLNGGALADFLKPGRGRDVVKGGAGGDRIFAQDGFRDVVFCGRGFDRVEADRRDRLRGCEERF